MNSFEEYLERKHLEYGDKFDSSNLNKDFIKYYENQERIEVDFGYEIKRGRVGVTTGWKPSFLLILTKRSIGSSYLIGPDVKVLKIIK